MIKLLCISVVLSFSLVAKRLPKHAVNPVNLQSAKCINTLSFKSRPDLIASINEAGHKVDDLLSDSRFDLDNLNIIHTALLFYPAQLVESLVFKLDKSRIKSPARYENSTIFIRAKTYFRKYKSTQRVGILIHEIAHSIANKLNKIDSSDLWVNIDGGWIFNSRFGLRPDGSISNGIPKKTNYVVSKRAMFNPGEDFAESVSLYRVEPLKLKQVSINKYNYIKTNVFLNIEYIYQCD